MSADTGDPRHRAAWFAAALVVAVVLVFGQVRSFGFINYDDYDYVLNNPHLREGSALDRVRWAFTSFHAANWHPLTWLSFMADAELFGLDPGRLHAENLALHAANVVLLLTVLLRMTGSVGKSALVAGLFALHPLRAESVAWVTERKGLLMALCSLAALHAHVSYARRPSFRRYGAVVGFVACALLAKPQAVTLPLLLLLFDWWPLGRIGGPSAPTAWSIVVREKLPLLALAGAVTVLTLAAQRQAGAVAPLAALPPGERIANAAVSPLLYLGKTLWPVSLSPAYPLAGQSGWLVAAAILTFAAAGFAAARWRVGRPWLIAGGMGFLVLLAPVSNLFQTGGQATADRYTYLPHFPLLVLLVWSGGKTLSGSPRLRGAAVACVVVLGALLGAAAHRQTAVWRDDLSLFSHAVAVTEGNWKMHYNLANTMERRGDYTEAERYYRLALEARPDYPEALNNLGALLGRRGEQVPAEALFAQAVAISPGYGPGWVNLGYLREQAGDDAGALQAYGRAVALQPGAAGPRVRMGLTLLRLGRRDEAVAVCREALKSAPESSGAANCIRDASAVPGR